MNTYSFLKESLRNFRQIGTLIASTRIASRRIATLIKKESAFVIEYGAGDGAITKALLEHLGNASSITAIEINPTLSQELSRIQDKRLHVVKEDIFSFLKKTNLKRKPDVVISGIPLSFLNKEKQNQLFKKHTNC